MLCFIVFLLCQVVAILGAPAVLEIREEDGAVMRRDVTAASLVLLNFYEQYAAAAYCVQNNNSPGNRVSCKAGNCPLVEAATTETITEFQNKLLTDVTGFVALDHTSENIVVSFRGTLGVRNWLSNLMFALVPATDFCDGCLIHDGFLKSYREARQDVMGAVKKAMTLKPGYSIMVTGHSLGGAIASLAAVDLRKQGHSVTLYTFGVPQTGNYNFAKYVTDQPGGNYRVTHTNDAVPKLPGLPGYKHWGPEYHITSGDNKPVSITDIDVVEGRAGNMATLGASVFAHGWYFNSIAACAPGGLPEFT